MYVVCGMKKIIKKYKEPPYVCRHYQNNLTKQ